MPFVETHTTSKQHTSRAAMGKTLSKWQLPPLPHRFGRSGINHGQGPLGLPEIARLTRSRLSRTRDHVARAQMEIRLIDWLYAAIRLNIKRGRLFELDRVLSDAEADCLGYARLFQQLGKWSGLDAGIVEVLIDNAGRMVPHVVNIVRFSDKRTRFIDLWYGSQNIRHRRLGLMVKEGGKWRIVDANWRELRLYTDIKGLPPRCVDAITGYMMGNRHLERGIRSSDAREVSEAIRCYTNAIGQYPQNARLYFNRAVAYENLGDHDQAETDYAVALHDQASRIRVQARQHDEVVRLMVLDRIALSASDEEMYLLQKGFITGREVSPQQIAAKYHTSIDEVNRITSRIESQLVPEGSTSLGQQSAR